MQSIFRRRNPDVQKLFQSAGDPKKVMCVAFDYAKKSHTSIICNGLSHQLRGRFDVMNNRLGLDYLLDSVGRLCRKHRIRQEHVFFGGEDCGSLAVNFIQALVARGFLIVGLNTKQVKDEREKSAASTDLIDTIGVAGMMLKMKGRTISAQSEVVHVVARLWRQRLALIKAHTAAANRIHGLVNQLFPGFLDEEQSGILGFGRASLWLMEQRFSPAEIHARRTPALTKKLREFNLQDPEGAARKLKALTETALPPHPAMIGCLQRSLHEELSLYCGLDGREHTMTNDIAKVLAKSPGAMLMTIPGIGPCWSMGLYAELADPSRRRGTSSMAALGGIVPHIKQTGGPEKPAVARSRTKRCSHSLKNVLMSSAVSIAHYGHPEVRESFQADMRMGRDARTRLAGATLRLALHIIDTQRFYLPPSLHKNGSHEQIRDYYLAAWRKVLIKWRDVGAIREAVAEGSPLRLWRDMAQELYDIELSIKAPQTGRK